MGNMLMAGSIAEERALGSGILPSSAVSAVVAGGRCVARPDPAAGAAEFVTATGAAEFVTAAGAVDDFAGALRPAVQGDVDAVAAGTEDAGDTERWAEICSVRTGSETGVAVSDDAGGLPGIGRPDCLRLCRVGFVHGVGLAVCPSPVPESDPTGSEVSSGTAACHISALVISAHLDARRIGNRCATAPAEDGPPWGFVTASPPPDRQDPPESS
ncbi:hypothetical protein [Nocardia nova]|jgi:hypothetical protein|uniref:hypothetical protein n=1 Tax=Nocardia nova TaxID=37330 RepID=UPI0018952EFD|nr:hypothetical protein [Nocardia nova]MBF6149165.1 hypothetical protein [Nocardia nova]